MSAKKRYNWPELFTWCEKIVSAIEVSAIQGFFSKCLAMIALLEEQLFTLRSLLY